MMINGITKQLIKTKKYIYCLLVIINCCLIKVVIILKHV